LPKGRHDARLGKSSKNAGLPFFLPFLDKRPGVAYNSTMLGEGKDKLQGIVTERRMKHETILFRFFACCRSHACLLGGRLSFVLV